ncbi:rod shape-determining protein MreC [Blattabacterium cuenoti]|uniref:rod shape-determining protein MreC n=1 Tax=Blattabacterium cuenoti TaxID=1653831 RepID=UPI00163B7A56|nr:rod shape-determining protein MreC [Blattabacterium cuenoti]
MRDFFYFLLKWRFLILFFLLEFVSIFFSFSNLNSSSKLIYNGSNFIVGSIYRTIYGLQNYFSLAKENENLLNENSRLHNESIFSNIIKISDNFKEKNIEYLQEYTFTPVKIIGNSINKQENYMIINKGSLDGIKIDMGLILPNGIAGIIIKTTPHFSTAMSLLNLKIKINARIKKNKNFGTILWNGDSYKYVILYDIPKYCKINIGDIIETDGKSGTFPEGIPIGTIKSYKLDSEHASFIIQVKLFTDFSTIGNAYVVKNLLKKEWVDINKVEN